MEGWASGIGGAALGIAGGIGGAIASAKQASKNRTFQEYMYKNRYQFQMADMRKAGLNPMLSYMQNPGAAPPGAMARIGNVADGAGNTALAGKRLYHEVANIRSNTEKNRAQADEALASEANLRALAAANTARELQTNLSSQALQFNMEQLKADAAFYKTEVGQKLRSVERAGQAITPFADVINGLFPISGGRRRGR